MFITKSRAFGVWHHQPSNSNRRTVRDMDESVYELGTKKENPGTSAVLEHDTFDCTNH